MKLDKEEKEKEMDMAIEKPAPVNVAGLMARGE